MQQELGWATHLCEVEGGVLELLTKRRAMGHELRCVLYDHEATMKLKIGGTHTHDIGDGLPPLCQLGVQYAVTKDVCLAPFPSRREIDLRTQRQQ